MQNTHLPAATAQWISQVCDLAAPGTIAAQVPAGYPSYVRIFHPAMDEDGAPVRWAEIARQRGHQLRGADLFEDVSGLDQHGDPLNDEAWVDGDVPAYELPIDQWQLLAGILSAHSGSDTYVAALWSGYAFIAGGERIQIDFEPDTSASPKANAEAHAAALARAQEPGLPAQVRNSPTFDRGGGYRNYHLFALNSPQLSNPLWAVTAAGEQRQRPGLVFPEDRAWVLSTEPYDDSTIVAGSRELIEAILAATELESLEVSELTRIGHSM